MAFWDIERSFQRDGKGGDGVFLRILRGEKDIGFHVFAWVE
jgi:hypothetical protein